MGLPPRKQIEEVLARITDDDYSMVLPEGASIVDKTKYELCKKFVKHLRVSGVSQADLARTLDIDRSRINWISKYRIEHFTIDKLLELWTKIDPKCELKVS